MNLTGTPELCMIAADRGAVARLQQTSLATSLRMQVPIRAYALARLLAKIAYGYAIYTYGVDNLVDVNVLPGILEQREDLAWWVGGSRYAVFESDGLQVPPGVHQIGSAVVNGQVFVVIRLFARLDPRAPEYMVVIGRLREEPTPQGLS